MNEMAKVNVEQRAIVGVFADPKRLEAAAHELQHKGFAADALGLVSPVATAPSGIGAGNAEQVGNGPAGAPLLASGTALRAVIEAAATASDPTEVLGAVGRRLEPAAEALPPGTMLLWVRVANGEEERKAVHVLRSQDARSTHRHQQVTPTAGEDPLSGMEPDPFLPGATV